MDSERTGWWKLFTRPGFEHCFAITYAPEQKCWFLMDWNIYFLVSQPLDDDMVELLFLMVRLRDYKVVNYKPRHSERVRYRIGWNYCVPAVKHLLGINSWAVTPYQLYRHLLRNGGKESFAGETTGAGR